MSQGAARRSSGLTTNQMPGERVEQGDQLGSRAVYTSFVERRAGRVERLKERTYRLTARLPRVPLGAIRV